MTKPIMVRPIWALMVIATCLLLVTATGIVYTNHVQRTADHRWCGLMRLIDAPRAPQLPPRTPEAQRAAEELHKIRVSMGC